ncbi:MAG: hypothetical protein ABIN57_08210 [Chitinophagaceae bacterium]
MKTMTGPSIVQIERGALSEFKAVKETLATHLIAKTTSLQNNNFGVIDLWKCRKKRRMYGLQVR